MQKKITSQMTIQLKHNHFRQTRISVKCKTSRSPIYIILITTFVESLHKKVCKSGNITISASTLDVQCWLGSGLIMFCVQT